MQNRLIYIVLTALLIASCSNRGTVAGGGVEIESDSLYSPRHAVGFDIRRVGDNNSLITIRNPWQGAHDVAMNLYISRDGDSAPEGYEGVVVHSPVKRIVCMSSSYVAFADALGRLDAVSGVSGARFIYNQRFQKRYADGLVHDVGYDTGVDYERIAALDPDLVLIYGVAGENSAMTTKLDELGVKVVYIADYLETTPLGKAEWIAVLGELLDKTEQANTIFCEVEADYIAVRAGADTLTGRPRVMLNAPWKDTWFVPGDRSYMVRLIVDAGGEYACRGVDSSVSRPISIESAFATASGSDVWLNPNQAKTLQDVVAFNSRFAKIPPVLNGRVYNCNRLSTPDGGSDVWDSGAVYPNIVLRDVIWALHPESMPEYVPVYFSQLKDE